MSKNWSLFLAAAFALGVGVKTYLDQQATVGTNTESQASVEASILLGKDDKPVPLFDTADDRIRIVYFGFTRCPDVCPTSLAMLAGALNEIDEETKAKVRPMFISLDPDRDGGNDSAVYAQYFHPLMEGLSGPLTVTAPIANKYGVIFRRTELEDSQLEYTLDHSSYFYFIQPDGTLITKVPHTLTPAPIVEAIKTVTKG